MPVCCPPGRARYCPLVQPTPTIKEAVGRCLRYATLTRAKQLIARWIGIVSAQRPAVVVRGCHCCTHGSGTQPDAHASGHVCSPIGAPSPRYTAAINSSAHCDAPAVCAPAVYAPAVSHGVSRNTRDSESGDYSNRNESSKRHRRSLPYWSATSSPAHLHSRA
jgi:hypothetical protein